MKKTTKNVSLLLAAALMAASIAGCAGKNSGNNANSSSAAATSSAAKDEKPTAISIFYDSPSTTCDRNNTQLLREVEKKTNTKITLVEAPSGQGNEKLNLLISAGECPDLVKAGIGVINKYGIEGALYPLEEIIDKHMPTAKKVLNKDVITKLKASDNKLYIAPTIRDLGGSAFYIREDWLKKLNLQVPKTLDEYYEVLKAFTEKDPDGNGKKDTFGTTMSENLGRFELISGPFGLPPQEFVVGDDGNLILSSVHPKMKEALAFGIKLFKEGLMDPEYATMKAQQYTEKVTNNKIGIMTNAASLAAQLDSTLKKTVPDSKYTIINVPVAPGVKKGYAAVSQLVEGTNEKSIAGQIAISMSTKQLEKVAKFLDWNYTEEAGITWTYGVEGKHYTMEGGKPKYKPEYAGSDNLSNRQKEGLWDMILPAGVIDQRTDGFPQVWSPDTTKNIAASLSSAFPKIVYFATPTGDAIGPEVNKTRQEYFTKIIMGGLSLEDGWNQWLKEFDRLGGNKWIKEVNDVYKARK